MVHPPAAKWTAAECSFRVEPMRWALPINCTCAHSEWSFEHGLPAARPPPACRFLCVDGCR